MTRASTILSLPFVILATMWAAGCRTGEPFEVPFFLEHEPEPDLVENTIPVLFSGWESRPERDETRIYVLYPGLHYVRQGREETLWFLTVPVYRNLVDIRGFNDVDMILGPVFYGHSVDEGSYLTVFPLGGTMRGLLGKEYAAAVLFPAFLYTEDRGFKSVHVLWPIFNVWYGAGHSGFRVFPFYAHYERVDVDGRLAYRRTWVLWPFFSKLENNLNSPAGAQRMWFLFPFFGRSEGPDTHQWTFLFPFFKYFENRGTGFGGPLWDLRAPWPLVRIVRGRGERLTDFWPFYGVRERKIDLYLGAGTDEFRRRFILWPIFRQEHHSAGDIEESRWWALPLLWSFSTEHKVEGWSTREFKVWPLFRYKRWADGRVAVNLLSPLWFEDPGGAFERIYGPLTRVYHEWRDDEGARRLEVLFGLYGEREWRTPAGEEAARTSLFFGLFQYERRGDRKGLRFFYLPSWPEWGGEEGEEEGEGGERAAPPGSPSGGGSGGQRTPG